MLCPFLQTREEKHSAEQAFPGQKLSRQEVGSEFPWAWLFPPTLQSSSPKALVSLGCPCSSCPVCWSHALPVLPLAVCRQADRVGGVGLGGRGGRGTQLLQQHPREGATPGRAGGLQAHLDTTLHPWGPGSPQPGQPLGFSGEGWEQLSPGADSLGRVPSFSFCSCSQP